MKRIGVVLFLALFSMIFSFHGFAYVIGDVNNDNKVDLTEAIHSLQVLSGVRTAASTTINVPADFPTIQKAIDAYNMPYIIINLAAGTYTEALTINNKAVTINGAGTGATILSAASGANILTIEGGKVIVSGVTLQGGQQGITAQRGAVIEVTDVVVQDVAAYGIFIDENSTARLNNVTVQRCGNSGIMAFRNSNISFYGTVASNNNMDGISIMISSSAYISQAIVTANGNSRYGIRMYNNSSLRSYSSSITVQNGLGNSGNSGRGIDAYNGSSIELLNSSSLLSDNNGYDGFQVALNSSFTMDSTCSMTVTNNGRRGLNIHGSGNIGISGTMTVNANAENGINLRDGSNLTIYTGTLNITNNVGAGINILAANLTVEPSGNLTVSGTTGAGYGIRLMESSLLVAGSLLVQNNTTGIGSDGTQVNLHPQSTNTAVIQNNGTGIQAYNGSGINGSGSVNITNNTVKDIILNFGSRCGLNTSLYGTIQCDGTCIASGVTCPVP